MRAKYISGPAAALIILFFFLPWITVSCSGTSLGTFSGFELVIGAVPPSSAYWLLWFIPLAALLVLALLLQQARAPALSNVVLWGQLAAAAVALSMLAGMWLHVQRTTPAAFELTIEPALWGTILGWIFVIVGAWLDFGSVQTRQRLETPMQSKASPVSAPPAALPKAAVSPLKSSPIPPQTATIPPEVEAPALSSPQTELLSLPAESRPLAWLVISQGEETGKHYRLRASTTLGRDPDCEITLQDTAVSGKHARIQVEDGRLLLQDLDSSNGVFLYRDAGWTPVQHAELQDGARVKIGRTVFHVMTLGPEQGGARD